MLLAYCNLCVPLTMPCDLCVLLTMPCDIKHVTFLQNIHIHTTEVLHGGQAEWDGRILVGSIVLCVGGWDPAATPLSRHIIRGLAVSGTALCKACVVDMR
jgi:hypothetical protein